MPMTRWVLRLIVANIAVYVMTMAAPPMVEDLMFVPALILDRPWTVVTYMFVHGDLWHIFFNMLGLFFFGPKVEDELGERDFLLLYFLGGISGGLLSVLTPLSAIIGASGALYSVMMAYAFFWPRAPIFLWGVFPVEARWLVVLMTALSLYGGFSGGDNVAHFAHLGGFLGGFLFLRWRATRVRQRMIDVAEPSSSSPTRADLHRWARIDRERLHEINREEFDRIQAKIRQTGAVSLTQTEREFLDRFSPE